MHNLILYRQPLTEVARCLFVARTSGRSADKLGGRAARLARRRDLEFSGSSQSYRCRQGRGASRSPSEDTCAWHVRGPELHGSADQSKIQFRLDSAGCHRQTEGMISSGPRTPSMMALRMVTAASTSVQPALFGPSITCGAPARSR